MSYPFDIAFLYDEKSRWNLDRYVEASPPKILPVISHPLKLFLFFQIQVVSLPPC